MTYFDSINDNDTTNVTKSIAASELEDFRAFRDNKIREAAISEGRRQASTEAAAAETAADADALAKLTARGLDLKGCFGNSSTIQGRNAILNLHRSSFANKSGTYTRLRRMAREQGLVS